MKHNKKRNTAFIYEALIRHMTDSIVCGDEKKKNTIIEIVTKHFKNNSFLKKDLDCYRSIYENNDNNTLRIITEAKISKRLIDPDGLFKAQTEIIHDINKNVGPTTFNVFVPNYKTLATISQIFSDKTSPKNKVILENQLISSLTRNTKEQNDMKPIDNLVYNSFVKKFNSEYGGKLLDEQKALLTNYITSFVDNAVELKTFLNSEVGRLKEELTKARDSDTIKDDEVLFEKTTKVIEKLNGLRETTINESVLRTVLSSQKLVKELSSNAD
jgi:hypothetical protein